MRADGCATLDDTAKVTAVVTNLSNHLLGVIKVHTRVCKINPSSKHLQGEVPPGEPMSAEKDQGNCRV